jgi:hypothetical protein
MVLAESDLLRWRCCLCKGRGNIWVCSGVSGDCGDLGLQEGVEGGAMMGFADVLILAVLLSIEWKIWTISATLKRIEKKL